MLKRAKSSESRSTSAGVSWPEPDKYTGYIRYFGQGSHQIYGHIRCIHTVLADPTHMCMCIYTVLVDPTHVHW